MNQPAAPIQSRERRSFQKGKRRYGEIAIEWSIRLVSSASILVIGLIFLFVLREAAGIFFMNTEKTVAKQVEEDSNLELRPEIYNPESGENVVNTEKTAAQQIEEGSNLELRPEIYNPESGENALAAAQGLQSNAPETGRRDFVQHISSISKSANSEQYSQAAVATKNIWQNLAGKNWQPVSEEPKFGLLPLLAGTAKTTFVAILLAAPIGIFAAVFVAFFAPRRAREIIKPFIEILAGFPSVVIGFFCLMTLATFLQSVFGFDYRLNSIIGGVGLAITVVPIIFTISEDALSSAPKTYREAALALGATEWETAFKVMLPAALPGIIAAVLLGIGRAFGETMIALMATGNAPLATWSFADPSRTFAATIGAEMGEVIWGSTHYSVLFFLGALLFVVSFGINLITELFVRRRLAKKFQGS